VANRRRSLGPNSLMIWTHNLRTGIQFQASFTSSDGCTASGWTGAAITYSAGYQWVDVYAVAQANNVIVVGGGDPVSMHPSDKACTDGS
jgi:hypothetical protein